MGCCLAALISDFPSAPKHIPSKATTTFWAKIAKGIDDGAEEMALLTRLEGEEGGVVSNDNPGTASSMMDASTRHNGNVPPAGLTNTTTTGAPSQQCHTPPPKQANQSAQRTK
jgi:hypothetical protein